MFLLCHNYSRVDTNPRNLCHGVPIKGDPITRQQVFFMLNAIMLRDTSLTLDRGIA